MRVANSDIEYLKNTFIYAVNGVFCNVPCFCETESLLVSSEKAELTFKMENETIIYCRKSLSLLLACFAV